MQLRYFKKKNQTNAMSQGNLIEIPSFFLAGQMAKVPQDHKSAVWKNVDKLGKFLLINLGLLSKTINPSNKEKH